MREDTLATLKNLQEHSVSKKQVEITKYRNLLQSIEHAKAELEQQLIQERNLARQSPGNGVYFDTWIIIYRKRKQGLIDEGLSVNKLINKCEQELMTDWRLEKKYESLINDEKLKNKKKFLDLEQKTGDELAISRHIHHKDT